MILKEIGYFEAFWGGFSSFYSIWQLCIMQISPFFIALAVTWYMLEHRDADYFRPRASSPLLSIFFLFTGYSIGFSTLFALSGASAMGYSGYIIYNLDTFKKIAGVYIASVAIFAVLYGSWKNGRQLRILSLPAGLLFGLAFSASYSPCIPPIMGDIMNFAGKPANAWKGFILLVVYGIGLSSAFCLAGLIATLTAAYTLKGNKKIKRRYLLSSSTLLLIMSFLLLSGLMMTYKTFLVGFVLD